MTCTTSNLNLHLPLNCRTPHATDVFTIWTNHGDPSFSRKRLFFHQVDCNKFSLNSP